MSGEAHVCELCGDQLDCCDSHKSILKESLFEISLARILISAELAASVVHAVVYNEGILSDLLNCPQCTC